MPSSLLHHPTPVDNLHSNTSSDEKEGEPPKGSKSSQTTTFNLMQKPASGKSEKFKPVSILHDGKHSKSSPPKSTKSFQSTAFKPMHKPATSRKSEKFKPVSNLRHGKHGKSSRNISIGDSIGDDSHVEPRVRTLVASAVGTLATITANTATTANNNTANITITTNTAADTDATTDTNSATATATDRIYGMDLYEKVEELHNYVLPSTRRHLEEGRIVIAAVADATNANNDATNNATNATTHNKAVEQSTKMSRSSEGALDDTRSSKWNIIKDQNSSFRKAVRVIQEEFLPISFEEGRKDDDRDDDDATATSI